MLKQRRQASQTVDTFIKATRSIDVFPKIQDDYQETSSSRGTYSILVFAIIIVLIVLEVRDFNEKRLDYTYEVDFDYVSKLKLNVDMTVATTCDNIGADFLDTTSVTIQASRQALSMTNTWFELSPKQQVHFTKHHALNGLIRNEYHAIHSAWFRDTPNFQSEFPEREVNPRTKMDACRIKGSLELNKVMGLFHVISGKYINFMGQHGHATPNSRSNFTHRIDEFSFGENTDLVANALNYELKVATSLKSRFVYFISVVAVEIGAKQAYQYSVTELQSQVDEQDQISQSGIYFKYDTSPIRVKINLETLPYTELLVPLIGIVGGIFATSTMLNSLYESCRDYLKAKF